MDQRMTMVTLGVRDLARAQKFYEEGLGWARGGGVEGNVAFYQLAGGVLLGLYGLEPLAEDATLELAALQPGKSFGGIALAYNVASPAEVDATLKEAEAAGGTLIKAGEKVFWGGYSGYFTDPDGHPWEVAHNPFWTPREDGTVSAGRAGVGKSSGAATTTLASSLGRDGGLGGFGLDVAAHRATRSRFGFA